jgi:peptidoglycan/LPS O-acetylase OafA/YrhL
LVLAWRCALVFAADVPMNRTYLATDTRVDSILFGCALALTGNPALDGEAPGERALWLRWLLPAGAALMIASLLFRDDRFRETFRYSLQGLALYPLFVCAIRNPRLPAFRLLDHPVLRRIGELSYSLYLLHHVVISGVQRWVPLPRVLQGAIALGLAFALSSAIWRWIERPCARLRKRFTPRASHPAPALAVAMGGRS